MISKGFRAIRYGIETILAKILWRNSLVVEGLFRKEADTQIDISKGGKLNIKRHVSFQRNVSFVIRENAILSIGKNVWFNHNCTLACRKKITIEDDVKFGPGVTIYDHDHIFSYEGVLPGYKLGEVIIGKGSWVAANVTILRNTHIGEGCVIGAGAVVQGNIPPHSLVTGSRELNIVPIENRE